MSLEDIRTERLQKIEALREQGKVPYADRTTRTHTIEEFLANLESLEQSNEPVTLAGRITSIREHGGLIFVDIFDGTAKTQAYVEREALDEATFTNFVALIDNGDIVEFTGMAFKTKRGMPSLRVSSWTLLTKSLLPIPDEWFGLKDEDARFRKRYLDIQLDPEVAARIKRRSAFWNTMRSYLLERDFVEVETPVLETTTGGADARPFETHHNALDIEVYLRISAGELWQKRLMVAGLPKVFEIGRIFRNEGMSFEHLQDYTQMEFYQAFSDYEQGMEMITDLYRTIAVNVYGTQVFTIRDQKVDFSQEWIRYDYCSLIEAEFAINPLRTDAESVAVVLTEKGIAFDQKGFNVQRGVDLLWKQIRKSLIGPGFLIGVPAYLEPLARRSSANPALVERFQVILAGSEMGKGFSELNDPFDQAARFAEQQTLRDQGDDEAQMSDSSYVEALEYGMPPTFGFGVSERFFSVLEGVSVREAQIFPLMKPIIEDEI